MLLADQQRRWATDAPLTVEDYLAGLPNLPGNVDWKLQLAIGEFEARRETKQPLSVDEISSRFPDLSDTLRDRLRKLSSAAQTSPKQSSPGPDDSAVDPAEIDRICDDYEAIWSRAEETPQLENFLIRAPAAASEMLLAELMKGELWWRTQRGHVPTAADYESRFPEDAS